MDRERHEVAPPHRGAGVIVALLAGRGQLVVTEPDSKPDPPITVCNPAPHDGLCGM
jgi:hypothetical protein